mmetsp:Transcript_22946/g.57080  ORF Transcript_22946/g.57080 Transcript_22946/m.57080 type:complete len:216 (-) Transcript_22946:29-676(-)
MSPAGATEIGTQDFKQDFQFDFYADGMLELCQDESSIDNGVCHLVLKPSHQMNTTFTSGGARCVSEVVAIGPRQSAMASSEARVGRAPPSIHSITGGIDTEVSCSVASSTWNRAWTKVDSAELGDASKPSASGMPQLGEGITHVRTEGADRQTEEIQPLGDQELEKNEDQHSPASEHRIFNSGPGKPPAGDDGADGHGTLAVQSGASCSYDPSQE